MFTYATSFLDRGPYLRVFPFVLNKNLGCISSVTLVIRLSGTADSPCLQSTVVQSAPAKSNLNETAVTVRTEYFYADIYDLLALGGVYIPVRKQQNRRVPIYFSGIRERIFTRYGGVLPRDDRGTSGNTCIGG